MKKLFLFLAISSLAIFTSCSNDEVLENKTENVWVDKDGYTFDDYKEDYEYQVYDIDEKDSLIIQIQDLLGKAATKFTISQVKTRLSGSSSKRWYSTSRKSNCTFYANGSYKTNVYNESSVAGPALPWASTANTTWSIKRGLILHHPGLAIATSGGPLAGAVPVNAFFSGLNSVEKDLIILQAGGNNWIVQNISSNRIDLLSTNRSPIGSRYKMSIVL